MNRSATLRGKSTRPCIGPRTIFGVEDSEDWFVASEATESAVETGFCVFKRSPQVSSSSLSEPDSFAWSPRARRWLETCGSEWSSLARFASSSPSHLLPASGRVRRLLCTGDAGWEDSRLMSCCCIYVERICEPLNKGEEEDFIRIERWGADKLGDLKIDK